MRRTDFQLIISDEAHRTISGNNRAIFEYFVGAKLGLTATPKDYLKGVNTADPQHDPREYERRLLLDTYRTFGCDDGQPTFRYSLTQAVQHDPPYLVNPDNFRCAHRHYDTNAFRRRLHRDRSCR